jgi:uncharacterized protein YcbK (DUF882 family)
MKKRPRTIATKHGHDLALSRRQFLYLGATLTAGLALPGSLRAACTPDDQKERRLILLNAHTHEELDVCYARGATYRPEALDEINKILRDHRTSDIYPIDIKLLDLLSSICSQAGKDACLHIVSGYRSPKTNRMLRKRSRRVARNSFHMQGKAVDIRIPGLSTKKLRRIAFGLKQGGVGYYPRSKFVHVDTGPIRAW